jgi:hypothetical protein
MNNLLKQYIEVKGTAPAHVNQLLDFIQREYVHGKLTIIEYRKWYKMLLQYGAQKPASNEEEHMENHLHSVM